MAKLTIIGRALSTFVRTARMACIEKGIDYDLQDVPLGSGEAARHHPFGKIPALRHGDFHLYETPAMVRYIDAAFDGPALTPADPRAAALMEQWISVNGSYLYPAVVGVILPRFGFVESDEASIAAAHERTRHCLGVLDRALGQNDWLAGSELSLADLFPAPVLFYFGMTPEGRGTLPEHVALGRWYERISGRESFRATVPELPS